MGRRTRGGGFARKPTCSEIGMERGGESGRGNSRRGSGDRFRENGRNRRRNLTEMRGCDRKFDRHESEVSAGRERGRDAFGRERDRDSRKLKGGLDGGEHGRKRGNVCLGRSRKSGLYGRKKEGETGGRNGGGRGERGGALHGRR